MESGFLLPDVDDETSAPFWAGCARGELLVQQCRACGKLAHPPRPMCPRCNSLDRTWIVTSGLGTVWSYIVVVVALDDEPTIRFVGNLVASADGAINEIDPATIVVGEPVQVVFQTVDGVAL